MAGRYRKPALIIVILAIIMIAAWYMLARGEDKIAVIHPVRGPVVQGVYATGTVEPTIMLPLGPRATGRLVELLADEGANVEKGAVLARLEDDNLRETLNELQARADLAQKSYGRKAVLVGSGAVAKEEVDQALADRDAAQAAVARAQAELDFLKLIAPESGIIIRRDGEIGEVIPSGNAVFWLARKNDLRIEAEVDEEDIMLVKPEQKVVIQADAFPDEIFNGTVTSITPKGDPVARSYRVRISIEEASRLMIGMTAETNIVIREEKNALLIPASAVLNNNKVFVIRDNKATEIEIETGAKTTDIIEARRGLKDDDIVILDAAQEIKPGDKPAIRFEKWKPRE